LAIEGMKVCIPPRTKRRNPREFVLVMATHLPETAALCDHVLELRDGLLQGA
jgi:ABC-type antimicrobial peptide transport system, ATPase component